MRARDLGIVIGRGRPGPHDAITDVPGVRVGHTTLIDGDGPLVTGRGPVRTGVTVVVPHDGNPWSEPVFAGCHRLNGNGELTGLEWIREAGQLGGAIGLDEHPQRRGGPRRAHRRGRPLGAERRAVLVAAGRGRDMGRQPQRRQRVPRPRRTCRGRARRGVIGAGCRGRGRRRDRDGLPRVQGRDRHGVAGRGRRSRRLDDRGPRAGQLRPAGMAARRRRPGRRGDPDHRARVSVRRVGRGRRGPRPPSALATGLARSPVRSSSWSRRTRHSSPTSALAWPNGPGWVWPGSAAQAATTRAICSSRGPPAIATSRRPRARAKSDRPSTSAWSRTGLIDPLFDATIEATEEAIVNALVAAETMVGRDGVTAHALPHDRLLETMARYGRPARPTG